MEVANFETVRYGKDKGQRKRGASYAKVLLSHGDKRLQSISKTRCSVSLGNLGGCSMLDGGCF